MKCYTAKKNGPVQYLLLAYPLIIGFIFFLDRKTFSERPFILLPLATPLVLLLWAYFNTSYKIKNSTLKYRSGFLKGAIEVSTIKEITKGKTMWIGIKPALAKNGLIIKYNHFEKIYIAPTNNNEMIADLLKLNPHIRVVSSLAVSNGDLE